MSKPNVAIILAVSNYSNVPPLPACKTDAEVLRSIISNTGKFATKDILVLASDTTSGNVKTELAKFLRGYEASGVEEVVFYYSGHGLFADQFYYLLTDFDDNRRRQTALANEELDQMLRALQPALAVKVVDACQSGQDYIKSRDQFNKSIKESEGRFTRCYFMFSSEQNQSSWASASISDFTFAFAQCLAEHGADSIRYKDITDYLADWFEGSNRQQPFFVTQGNHTETFCNLTPIFREAVRAILPKTSTPTTTPSPGKPAPAVDDVASKIKALALEEAKAYCDEAEALEKYTIFLKHLESLRLPPPLRDLYTVSVEPSKKYDVPSAQKLGEWVRSNKHPYFAKATTRTEEYEAWEPKVHPFGLTSVASSLALITGDKSQLQSVTRTREIISGISSAVEKQPYRSIYIRLTPLTQNLPWISAWVAAINSKTHFRIFYAMAKLVEVNWSDRIAPTSVEWRTAEAPLKDENKIRGLADEVMQAFGSQGIMWLTEKYAGELGPQTEVPEEKKST